MPRIDRSWTETALYKQSMAIASHETAPCYLFSEVAVVVFELSADFGRRRAVTLEVSIFSSEHHWRRRSATTGTSAQILCRWRGRRSIQRVQSRVAPDRECLLSILIISKMRTSSTRVRSLGVSDIAKRLQWLDSTEARSDLRLSM